MELDKAKSISYRVVALEKISKKQKILKEYLVQMRRESIHHVDKVKEFAMLGRELNSSDYIDIIEFMIEKVEGNKLAIEKEIENIGAEKIKE